MRDSGRHCGEHHQFASSARRLRKDRSRRDRACPNDAKRSDGAASIHRAWRARLTKPKPKASSSSVLGSDQRRRANLRMPSTPRARRCWIIAPRSWFVCRAHPCCCMSIRSSRLPAGARLPSDECVERGRANCALRTATRARGGTACRARARAAATRGRRESAGAAGAQTDRSRACRPRSRLRRCGPRCRSARRRGR